MVGAASNQIWAVKISSWTAREQRQPLKKTSTFMSSFMLFLSETPLLESYAVAKLEGLDHRYLQLLKPFASFRKMRLAQKAAAERNGLVDQPYGNTPLCMGRGRSICVLRSQDTCSEIGLLGVGNSAISLLRACLRYKTSDPAGCTNVLESCRATTVTHFWNERKHHHHPTGSTRDRNHEEGPHIKRSLSYAFALSERCSVSNERHSEDQVPIYRL